MRCASWPHSSKCTIFTVFVLVLDISSSFCEKSVASILERRLIICGRNTLCRHGSIVGYKEAFFED